MHFYSPPAPEPGATRVMTGQSPILAQTFTEPFVVYSAKRFPGVPGIRLIHFSYFVLWNINAFIDTTALSIAFGNQGQKLPLVSP